MPIPKDATPASWNNWANWTIVNYWSEETYRALNSANQGALAVGSGGVAWNEHSGAAPTYVKQPGTVFVLDQVTQKEMDFTGDPESTNGTFDSWSDSDYLSGPILASDVRTFCVGIHCQTPTSLTGNGALLSRIPGADNFGLFIGHISTSMRVSSLKDPTGTDNTDFGTLATSTEYWVFGNYDLDNDNIDGYLHNASGTQIATGNANGVDISLGTAYRDHYIGRGGGINTDWDDSGEIYRVIIWDKELNGTERTNVVQGNNLLEANMLTDYNLNLGSELNNRATSPSVDLSDYSGNTWIVEWWQVTNFEAGAVDTAIVEILVDGVVDQTISKTSVFTAKGTLWERKRVQLTGVDGESNVQIRFSFDPVSAHAGTGEGWYIDAPRILAIA